MNLERPGTFDLLCEIMTTERIPVEAVDAGYEVLKADLALPEHLRPALPEQARKVLNAALPALRQQVRETLSSNETAAAITEILHEAPTLNKDLHAPQMQNRVERILVAILGPSTRKLPKD